MLFFYIFAGEILTAFSICQRVFVFTQRRVGQLILLNFFLLSLFQTKTIFTMRQLTLLKLLFALALVCKMASIGQFETMSWAMIFLPLLLHYVVAFIYWYARAINLKKLVDEEVIFFKAKRQLKKTDGLYKTAVEMFKEELKNEK